MTIHTVTPGQTLFSIGAEYGVAPGLLARWNGLTAEASLAVGQSLLILTPQTLYTVRPGDTLYAIAGRFGVSPLELLRNNPNLGGSAAVYPGQVLVIRFAEQAETQIDVSGYAYPYVREEILRGILPYATIFMPFTYGFTEDGTLIELDDRRLISLAAQYGVLPYLHLSTLTEDGSFSSARAQRLFENPAAQEKLLSELLRVARERGYRGFDLDFEFVEPEYAADYAAFAGRVREIARLIGGELITALAPKVSADQPGVLYEGHDYAALAANSDAVLLMTYEWGYTYGPPMAVSPLPSVRRVLDYAVTEIPPEKIFMGFPNYAYNWTLPYVAGSSRAQLISNEAAVQLAVRYRAEIRFDASAQTPYFHYTDEGGAVHEVWFEDPRSCQAKYRLIGEYGFRGIGFWNFMRSFTSGFLLLHTMYRIRRGSDVKL